MWLFRSRIRGASLWRHAVSYGIMTSLFCVVISGSCIEQKITIKGTVRDTSGKGISGASVKLEQANISTKTGADGNFILKTKKKSKNSSTPAKELSVGSSAKQADAAPPMDDVLTVTKEGLLNRSIAIKNFKTSGLDIKMLPNAGNVTDIDGNVYQSVRIGNQVWTTENLKTTKYNDGTAITYVPDSATTRTPGFPFVSSGMQNEGYHKNSFSAAPACKDAFGLLPLDRKSVV